MLKIRANYSKCLAQNEAVLSALQLNGRQLPECIQPLPVFTVAPGPFFMHNGNLVQVVRINQNSVVLRNDETFNEYTLDLNEVIHLIRSYLE